MTITALIKHVARPDLQKFAGQIIPKSGNAPDRIIQPGTQIDRILIVHQPSKTRFYLCQYGEGADARFAWLQSDRVRISA